MLSKRHEQQLSEIEALTYELDENTRVVLERIGEARAQLVVPAPLLAFVHIPKTAGATFLSMLVAAYSREAVQDVGNYFRNPERTVATFARRSKREGRVVAGHVPCGVFEEHVPADTRYMTFIREPTDRVLSHYYRHLHRRRPTRPTKQRSARREQHRLETPGKVKVKRDRRPKADSIEEAIVEMRMPQLNNLATRFLCGHPSPMGELPASALEEAKANLRKFAFVGMQERFEESLVLLQRMLGVGDLLYRDRHVSSDRPSVAEISDDQRALIAEYNQLDAELYRFASGLFEDAVARAGEGFADDVEALRALSATVREEEWREVASPRA